MVLKQWRDTQAECSQSDLEMAAALKAKVSKKIVLMEGFAKFKSHEVHLFLEGDFFVFCVFFQCLWFKNCLITPNICVSSWRQGLADYLEGYHNQVNICLQNEVRAIRENIVKWLGW